MERVYKIVAVKPGQNESAENPIEMIKDKNVLLLATMIDSGRAVERLMESLAQFQPKNLKIAVAF